MKLNKHAQEYVSVVVAELTAAGITDHWVSGGTNHPSVVFEVNGKALRIVFPSSPSDRRGSKNLRSIARRIIAKAKETDDGH